MPQDTPELLVFEYDHLLVRQGLGMGSFQGGTSEDSLDVRNSEHGQLRRRCSSSGRRGSRPRLGGSPIHRRGNGSPDGASQPLAMGAV